MRRALLLAMAALAAPAVMATSAQAGVIDGTTGDPCPAVSLSGNTVSGGCLVEDLDGDWSLMTGGGGVAAICPLTFDVRVANGGDLYAVNQTGGICSGYQRRPCTDTATGEVIPWPGTVVVVPGVGAKERINMCFTTVEGGIGGWENVTFTPNWDANDYFDSFTQYGASQSGAITDANFYNEDSTAIKRD